jgi:hypothetical protein
MKIGNSMASIFGGSCINAEYDEEKKVGTFYCIERGEEFIMEETEEELLKHEKEWC